MTWVARRPSTLNRGPAATRARKPSAITATSHSQPVASVSAAEAATPAATTRAAFSLTGFGKLKAAVLTGSA